MKKNPLILSIGEEWLEFHWLAYFQVEKFVLCDGSHSKNEKQCVIHKIDSGWHLMKTVEINRKSLLLLLYFVLMKLCFFSLISIKLIRWVFFLWLHFTKRKAKSVAVWKSLSHKNTSTDPVDSVENKMKGSKVNELWGRYNYNGWVERERKSSHNHSLI